MTKICKTCGAEDGAWVTRRSDGSNGWALDLDLAEEYPKHWSEPTVVKVKETGVCRYCTAIKIREGLRR